MLQSDKRIPLTKPSVGEEELKEIRAVLESGWLAQGPKVREFEQKVASYLGAKHAVATSSCTAALSLAVDALQLPRGKEVVVPDFTFPATANVVVRAGLGAVMADVRPATYALDTSEFKKGLTSQTIGVMPVHPFGHPFEMDEVYEIAESRSVDVIEDAATAFGTRYRKKKVGSEGRAVCFSFHPRKVLTTAEGGCFVTDDNDVYERAASLRNHGQVARDGKIQFVYNGLNYRMSDIHAAIGLAQLRKIDAFIEQRRGQARVYDELLRSTHLDIKPPVETEWAYHTYQSYVTVLGKSFPDRVACMQIMREKFQVETQVGTYSVGSEPAFSKLRRTSDLSNSKMLFSRSLTLPLFEGLTEEDQGYVVDSLSKLPRAS